MKFVPKSVMSGFLNALGILVLQHNCHSLKCNLANVRACRIGTCNYIFISTYYDGCTVHTYCNYHRDKYCTYEWITIKTVGDMGSLPKELPFFSIPDVPFTLETLGIILPYAVMLAIIGLLESLLTASVLDDMTHTESNKHKEARGQGIANIVAGFFGGMAGCAMIGQSVINIKSGGRGRLSTFVAGGF